MQERSDCFIANNSLCLDWGVKNIDFTESKLFFNSKRLTRFQFTDSYFNSSKVDFFNPHKTISM